MMVSIFFSSNFKWKAAFEELFSRRSLKLFFFISYFLINYDLFDIYLWLKFISWLEVTHSKYFVQYNS